MARRQREQRALSPRELQNRLIASRETAIQRIVERKELEAQGATGSPRGQADLEKARKREAEALQRYKRFEGQYYDDERAWYLQNAPAGYRPELEALFQELVQLRRGFAANPEALAHGDRIRQIGLRLRELCPQRKE